MPKKRTDASKPENKNQIYFVGEANAFVKYRKFFIYNNKSVA